MKSILFSCFAKIEKGVLMDSLFLMGRCIDEVALHCYIPHVHTLAGLALDDAGVGIGMQGWESEVFE